MRIPLPTRRARIALLAGVAVLALIYVVLTGAQFLAAFWGGQAELSSLQRAVWLEPGNAEYRFRTGRYIRLVQRDANAAAASYRAAVGLNPHQARYWFDLAATYELLGDTSAQESALDHAIDADPTTPEVAWQAANFFVVQGEMNKAMKEFRVVLANDPTLPAVAIPLIWRIEPNIDPLLQDVIPPIASVYSSFLEYLVGRKELAAANKVWARLAPLQQPVERRYIFSYIRSLLLDQEVDQARTVWRQAANLSDLAAYQPTPQNLVVNGNFNLDVLNGGFDWMYDHSPQVSLLLDPTQSESGHRSLLMTFDAQGINDAGIRQAIPVSPNTGYEFSAYYKAQDIEAAGGLRFAIQDVYSGAALFTSDNLDNVEFWKQVTGDFVTGPQTKLLVLHIQRFPQGPIKGKLWIDTVSLIQKPPATAPPLGRHP